MPIRKEMRQRYPKDWALRSRFVRFYRARNRCEWCGVHNYSLREDTGAVVVLTAAHRVRQAAGDLRVAQPGGTLPTVSPPPRRQGPHPGQAGKGPRSAAGAGDLKRPFGKQPAALTPSTNQRSDPRVPAGRVPQCWSKFATPPKAIWPSDKSRAKSTVWNRSASLHRRFPAPDVLSRRYQEAVGPVKVDACLPQLNGPMRVGTQ